MTEAEIAKVVDEAYELAARIDEVLRGQRLGVVTVALGVVLSQVTENIPSEGGAYIVTDHIEQTARELKRKHAFGVLDA